MTLQQRIDIANQLRNKGYNCAQCVAMAFNDIHNIPNEIISKLTIGLGGGVGGQGEICGVVSAMTLVEGCRSDGQPSDKRLVYPSVTQLSERFKALNGSTICRQLKSATPPRPCNELIIQGIQILHDHINQNK